MFSEPNINTNTIYNKSSRKRCKVHKGKKKDFEKTIKLMKDVKFINSFSFVFNKRPGTPAANLKKINDNICKDRLINFQDISHKIKKNYREKLLNTTSFVLFENLTKVRNSYFGRDEFYNSVIVTSNDNLIGKIKKIKIIDINHNTMFGNINNETKKENFAAWINVRT